MQSRTGPAVGIVSLICILGLPPLAGQQEATISVDVAVVNVLATVRDRKGGLVNDLEKDDFVLEVEGEPKDIRYFARQTDLPLTIGLLVDTSVSQQRVLGVQRSASAQFFSNILRHRKDLAFLMSFDVDVELLQDLTDSQRLLQSSLEKLEIQGSTAGITPGPIPQSTKPVGTALYDSVFLACDEMMRHQVGRKALVLISDGNDYGSKVSKETALEAAHRADVVVYAVRYFDRDFYYRTGGFGSGGRSALRFLSQETGGSTFEVTKKQPLTAIFEQIQEELRSQYSIGFSPSVASSEGLRRIELSTKDKKLSVQARSGYYAKAGA